MKVVLTGGSSSGKTSVVDELQKRGYRILPETATEVLQEYQGRPLRDIQQEILVRQYERELALPKNRVIFLDRSLIDCIAYARDLFHILPIPDVNLSEVYDHVCMFDRLPFVRNSVRMEETEAEAQRVHDLVIDAYKHQGYNPIRVPKMSIEERTEFILETLKLK